MKRLICTITLMLVAIGAKARAEDAKTPPGPPVLVGYDGGFFIRTPNDKFLLKIGARLQARLEYDNNETHETADDGTALSATDRDYKLAFSIPRARLKLFGNAFTKNLTYLFQVDFGKGFVMLRDFYADYAFFPKALQLRVGQFKRPFSRQQITSSGNQELVDRAITDEAFGAGRDLGLMFHDDYESSPPFEWALGVFNGTGDKPTFTGKGTGTGTVDQTACDPATQTCPVVVDKVEVTDGKFFNVPTKFDPMLVARLGYNYGGIKGYSEADLEGGPARFAIAASALADFDVDNDDKSSVRGEADLLLKVYGFDLTGAVYVASAQDGKRFADQKYASVGFHGQVGYVVKNLFQPVFRYAIVNPDGKDNNTQELLGGVAFYFFKHNVKWQTDGGAYLVENAAGGLTNYIVRTQLQFAI